MMIFERHAHLKYRYGNRHFWCRGYFVDTAGKNAKKIEQYIRNQMQEDLVQESSLYNTSVLVGPEGYIGKYRKIHLWDREKLWYEPGDLGIPVFNTPIGRIAMIICYDMWFQEMWRICSAKGADIVCCPVNWVRIAALPKDVETFGPYNAMVGAYDNALCVAIADRVGEERGLIFPGRSMILSPIGLPVGGEASGEEEEIKYADLNLLDSRRLHWAEFAGAMIDRRTDYYDPLCGVKDQIMPI